MQCLHLSGMPLRTWLVHARPSAVAIRSRYVHRVLRAPERLHAETILEAARTHRIDVILPVAAAGIRLMSSLRDVLPLGVRLPPLERPEVLDRVEDKWLLHQALVGLDYPRPRTDLLTASPVLRDFDPDEPVLLKPRRGESGIGIIHVAKAGAIAARADLQALVQAGYIVQAFVTGPNVDRSVLGHAGTIVAATTQQALAAGKGFGPSGRLRFAEHAGVTRYVDGLFGALAWNGVAHVDTVIDPGTGDPHIVDVNPRYWATLLGSLAAGVNFPGLQLRQAMGMDLGQPRMQALDYTGLQDWILRLLRQGAPLRSTSFFYHLADPWPKVHAILPRWRRAGR